MIKNAPPKYAATFCVEADSRGALEVAVEYVMKRLEGGLVGHACGLQSCVCKVEVEWDGAVLAVKTCTERTAYAVAKLLVMAYTWLGGKAIQVIKHEEQTP
jgi:hypothetical protein